MPVSHKIVAIIQSRMDSQRLPGKMMMDLCGAPIMRWVLERVRAARSIHQIVLATTTRAEDDILANLANQMKIEIFRGHPDDVFSRYLAASRLHKADVVVRVCGDNPLVAPEQIDRAVGCLLEETPDYAYNNMHRGRDEHPRGVGAEVFWRPLLEKIKDRPLSKNHREHVTAYFWDHEEEFKILSVPCPEELRDPFHRIKLDLDTPEDLNRLRSICGPLTFSSAIKDILHSWESYNRRPHVSGNNRQ